MSNSQQEKQEPLRRPSPTENRSAKYANRPPAPQVVFIQPAVRRDGSDFQQSLENRDHQKMKKDGLRMTKPAAEAARRSNISEAQIRSVLENPNDVEPDRDNPDKTRFTKGSLIVVAGKDGVVLAIYKR